MARKSISHNELFALVLDELLVQLGDIYPAADLIRAAERLAALVDSEFKVEEEGVDRRKANYYSYEIDWAFSSIMWQIVYREECNDLLGDQRTASDEKAMSILKRYLDSW